LHLDAELACRCDAGEVESYETPLFEAIVEPVLNQTTDDIE
jgi:hypothetical protein